MDLISFFLSFSALHIFLSCTFFVLHIFCATQQITTFYFLPSFLSSSCPSFFFSLLLPFWEKVFRYSFLPPLFIIFLPDRFIDFLSIIKAKFASFFSDSLLHSLFFLQLFFFFYSLLFILSFFLSRSPSFLCSCFRLLLTLTNFISSSVSTVSYPEGIRYVLWTFSL